MRIILVITLLLLIKTSFSQVKMPEKIYLNYTPQGDRLGYLTQILKLYKDSSFSIYYNDDQGDILHENIVSGRYSIMDGVVRFFPETQTGWNSESYAVYLQQLRFEYSDSLIAILTDPAELYAAAPRIFQRINFHDLTSFRIIIEQFIDDKYTITSHNLFEDHYIFYTRKQDSCSIKSNVQSWVYLDSTRFGNFADFLSGNEFFEGIYKPEYSYAQVECRLPGVQFKFVSQELSVVLQKYLYSLAN